MGRIDVILSNETEKRLRNALAQRKKGDLSKAIEEALKDWLEKRRSR